MGHGSVAPIESTMLTVFLILAAAILLGAVLTITTLLELGFSLEVWGSASCIPEGGPTEADGCDASECSGTDLYE